MRHNNQKTVVTIRQFSISSRHNHFIALLAVKDVISSSFGTATCRLEFISHTFKEFDHCCTDKTLYGGFSPMEDANGLTSTTYLHLLSSQERIQLSHTRTATEQHNQRTAHNAKRQLRSLAFRACFYTGFKFVDGRERKETPSTNLNISLTHASIKIAAESERAQLLVDVLCGTLVVLLRCCARVRFGCVPAKTTSEDMLCSLIHSHLPLVKMRRKVFCRSNDQPL
ncbi:hypothetical protein T11_17784 [Trichinella zimbabwensis]|uniref:Uncharacterized protein n=1 Tax=Trichinella zimbabwensis TaxID=268475 RepID=A0A0V1H1J1_9BILA|nr:hypothetical protein T11_17784 [Trichinella zimbabwensis]